mgnify:CR=1 FL=1
MYDMLSFAAGVMLSISFLELIPESLNLAGPWLTVAGIVVGSLLIYFVDVLVPHIHPELCGQEHGRNLKKTAIYLLLGIGLHNFPEGMAIAIGTVTDLRASIAVALAIAIHNIPEGICTSAPYFHSTGQRLNSFLLSSLTAIPIVLGFITAYYLFQNIPPSVVGFIIAVTAGLMIYICADELIPFSAQGQGHSTIFTLILGVVFLILLGLI